MPEIRSIVLLSADPTLRAEVGRLAALVGVEVDVVESSLAVRAVWRTATVVMVGADLTETIAASLVPRRSAVFVVALAAPGEALWRRAVDLGATRLLTLPADEHVLVDALGETEPHVEGSSIVAVIGGCGGAGASTLAAAIAITGSRTAPTLLVDADPLGGGIDVLLGLEQHAGARWSDLADARGRLSASALSGALIGIDGLAVLPWDRATGPSLAPEAVAAVLDAATRTFHQVVVDLPRWADPATAVWTSAADLIVVVVPASLPGTVAAVSVARALADRPAPIRLVVRDPGGARLGVAEVAEALGLPLLATLRTESSVAAAADRGELPIRRGRGSLADVATAVQEVLRDRDERAAA